MNTLKPLVAALAMGALVLPLSAPAQGQGGSDELTRHLRACLSAGAGGAPKDSLFSAVAALRSLCGVQIKRVRAYRLAEIDRHFGLPGAKLTPQRKDELERAHEAATRALNDEVALAISNFTGLTS